MDPFPSLRNFCETHLECHKNVVGHWTAFRNVVVSPPVVFQISSHFCGGERLCPLSTYTLWNISYTVVYSNKDILYIEILNEQCLHRKNERQRRRRAKCL